MINDNDEYTPCLECGLWSGSYLGAACRARGSENPELMIIGEAPGNCEDEQGKFFVGPSGKQLMQWLFEAGFNLDNVRYENIVRCIPKTDYGSIRKPTPREVGLCIQFLYQEIARTKPKLILILGGTALEAMLNRKAITKFRGQLFTWLNPADNVTYPIIPTIHPAAVLRGNIKYKSQIIADVNHAKQFLYGSSDSCDYDFLTSVKDIRNVLSDLRHMVVDKSVPYIAVDTETHPGLNPWNPEARLLCWSLCGKEGKAFCIPLSYSKGPFYNDGLYEQSVKSLMRNFLADVPTVGQNIKFDYKWSKIHGGSPILNIVFDTFLAAWILFSDTETHDLDSMAAVHLGMYAQKQRKNDALNALPKESRFMDNIDVDVFSEYACRDADVTFRLTNLFSKMLKDQNLYDAYKLLSLEMIQPFAEIELDGCFVDKQILQQAADLMIGDLAKFDDFICSSGLLEEFNCELQRNGLSKQGVTTKFLFNSTKHVATLLFDILGLPINYRTEKGAPKVDKKVLHGFVKYFEKYKDSLTCEQQLTLDVLENLLDVKKTQKLYSTYVIRLPTYMDTNNILHTVYNIGATATGRFSSSDPSIHTLPWKSQIKNAFRSRFDGGVILDVDYAQIELRILACLSKDSILCKAFADGEDIHRSVAAAICKKTLDTVTTEERRRAKTASFGIVYGQGPSALALNHGLTEEDAVKLIDDYMKTFLGVKSWIRRTKSKILETGEAFSLFGRRRLIPQAFSSINDERSAAQRLAVNTPIQGTASELTSTAVKRIFWRLKSLGLQSVLFGFVHDSIVLDIYPGELLTVLWVLYKEMQLRPHKMYDWLIVPLEFSFELGYSWGEKVDLLIDFKDTSKFKLEGDLEFIGKLQKQFDLWNPPLCFESSVSSGDKQVVTFLFNQ